MTTSAHFENKRSHWRSCVFVPHPADRCSMFQDGALGDDNLSAAAGTPDGGVVVAGNSNGTYNGVASEGSTDFVAIKLGTLATLALIDAVVAADAGDSMWFYCTAYPPPPPPPPPCGPATQTT